MKILPIALKNYPSVHLYILPPQKDVTKEWRGLWADWLTRSIGIRWMASKAKQSEGPLSTVCLNNIIHVKTVKLI